jgi:hypothetical protein
MMMWRAIWHSKNGFGFYTFLAFGFIFLMVGIVSWIRTESFLKDVHRTSAQIVNLKSDGSSGNDVVYSPVFQFVAEDGRSYTVESNSASRPPEFVVGQVVTVLYLPSDPMGARIETPWQIWSWTRIGLLLGFSFTSIALISGWWQTRKLRRARAPANSKP